MESEIFLNGIEENGARSYIAPILYAGIAKYKNNSWENVLINKYIDDIAKSFVGVPVVEGHYQPTSFDDPAILGVVDEVFCNGEGFVLANGDIVYKVNFDFLANLSFFRKKHA
jgi:hypothetical protein